MNFTLKNCFFKMEMKMKIGFLKQFVLCINLFSKLEKSASKSQFQFCSSWIKAEKANFPERNTFFFCKRCSLRFQTFLSLQTCWNNPLDFNLERSWGGKAEEILLQSLNRLLWRSSLLSKMSSLLLMWHCYYPLLYLTF